MCTGSIVILSKAEKEEKYQLFLNKKINYENFNGTNFP